MTEPIDHWKKARIEIDEARYQARSASAYAEADAWFLATQARDTSAMLIVCSWAQFMLAVKVYCSTGDEHMLRKRVP